MTFPELVHLHFLWRRAIDARPADGEPGAEELGRYQEALARFEECEGQIVSAYWCSDLESAVALTMPRRKVWLPGMRPTVARFHRVSDWATRDRPPVGRLMHECDELAIKAREVLGSKSQRVCMQLVMASASHLLSLVDVPRSAHGEPIDANKLKPERDDLQAARDYYREAANSEAQMVYFAGIGAGAAVLLAVAVLVSGLVGSNGIDSPTFFGSLSAGALGALVSVIARINDGTFALDYDVSRWYSFFLGALRPVIGAIFGLAVFSAVDSGLVQIFKVPDDHTKRFYFLCVVAFVAGFSERWAQDTLTSAAPAARTPGEKPADPPPAAVADQGREENGASPGR